MNQDLNDENLINGDRVLIRARGRQKGVGGGGRGLEKILKTSERREGTSITHLRTETL